MKRWFEAAVTIGLTVVALTSTGLQGIADGFIAGIYDEMGIHAHAAAPDAASTPSARAPAGARTADASAPTTVPSAVPASTVPPPFTPPPKPTDEREIDRHCAGVTYRLAQVATMQLQDGTLNAALRAIYETRLESAKSHLGMLGMLGAKADVLDEKETHRVAYQYALARPDRPDDMYLTAPASDRPNANEEALWLREQWCEAELTDFSHMGSTKSSRTTSNSDDAALDCRRAESECRANCPLPNMFGDPADAARAGMSFNQCNDGCARQCD